MNNSLLLDQPIPLQALPNVKGTHPSPPACPLTGSQHIQVLEDFSTTLLVDGYQRDLALDVASEFVDVERLQLCRCLDSHVIFFYPAVSGSSRFYQQLQTFDWYYQASKFEYQRAANWIKPGDRVLDIGCGAAQLVNYIPGATYLGLEPHFGSGAYSFPLGTRILAENVTRHAISNSQTYDVVCAFQVLEHIENLQAFLMAALSCLKPNGLLILGVPSADSYITRIPNFVLNAPPHHLTWWTDEALCHLADRFRLSILDLAHAPVESWETRLYWMQRALHLFDFQESLHFTESKSRRVLNIAAYMFAGCMQKVVIPPIEAQGASVVMVAQKDTRLNTLSQI